MHVCAIVIIINTDRARHRDESRPQPLDNVIITFFSLIYYIILYYIAYTIIDYLRDRSAPSSRGSFRMYNNTTTIIYRRRNAQCTYFYHYRSVIQVYEVCIVPVQTTPLTIVL